MHLKSLKVFCDVVGKRSFSQAADENGISQSGASQMVLQMEDHLGVRLIDRSKRPFVLTPEGAVYYDGCRKIIQKYYELEEDVKLLHADVAGSVDIASIFSVGLSHLNHYVQSFRAGKPLAKVRVQYQHPHRVLELVENDQVDIGLVSYPKSSRTISVIPWREEPMVVVCSVEHAFAVKTSMSLGELDGCEVISFDRQLRIRRAVDRALSQHGAEVRTVMEFDNTETLKRAIEINAGVGILPLPTIQREVESDTLKAIPIIGTSLNRPLGIIHRRTKRLNSTARRFVDLLLGKADGVSTMNTNNGNGALDSEQKAHSEKIETSHEA